MGNLELGIMALAIMVLGVLSWHRLNQPLLEYLFWFEFYFILMMITLFVLFGGVFHLSLWNFDLTNKFFKIFGSNK